MLQSLKIQNFALISQLSLRPIEGLNIITGETGAGKSIMLGAVGLLLGNRADTKVLLEPEIKCVIEGEIEIEGYDLEDLFEKNEIEFDSHCIVRREISPQGKSRAFVNDTPVNLEFLKLLGDKLISIHSQHDTLQLSSADYQFGILDAFGGLKTDLKQYQETYKDLKIIEQNLNNLKQKIESEKAEADYHAFQLEELKAANLLAGEQEQLENELDFLENAENIKARLFESLQLMNGQNGGVIDSLKVISSHFEKLSGYSTFYKELADRLKSSFEELKDIAREIEKEEHKIDISSERIEFVKTRLSTFYSLQKKYRKANNTELLAYKSELESLQNEFLNSDEKLEKLNQQFQTICLEAETKSEDLSQKRKAVVPVFEKELMALCAELGMLEAQIKIVLEETGLYGFGKDKINFLFSANKGIAPKELKQVASGGEFSRLMLAIRYLMAGKTALPTLILDEIDTGISGEIARKVGIMLQKMSTQHQLIAITHTPQIASKGKRHFFVFKDHSGSRTTSSIKELNAEERVLEIAQMISGKTPSETALQNAKELLEEV